MALTTGSAIYVGDVSYTDLDCNGATTALLASGAVDVEANKVSIASPAPLCTLALRLQVAVTTVAGAAVHIYRRTLLADGTTDASIPTLDNKQVYVGSFTLPTAMAVDTDYVVDLDAVPLSMLKSNTFYIENDSGQQINAGWVLTVTVATYNAQA